MLNLINRIVTPRNIIIFAFFFSWFCTYSYIDFNLNASIGEGYIYLAKSIVLSRNFNLNEYWGNAGFDVVKTVSGYYSAYAPMTGVLIGVPYFVLQIGYYIYTNVMGPIDGNFSIIIESLAFGFASSFAYALSGYFLYKILNIYKISKSKVILVLISYLFGSIILNYSVSYLNHVFSTLFIISAYFAVIGIKRESISSLTAGILIGFSFLTEYPTVLFSVAFLFHQIYQFYRDRNLKGFLERNVLFAIPVVISICLIGIYNWNAFGSPFTFSEKAMYTQNVERELRIYSFSQNIFYGLFGFYLSPLKGLFLISPALLLGFWGIKKYFRRDAGGFILAGSYILIMSVLYAGWSDCFGATPYGPRYLTSLTPLLFIFVGFGIRGKYSLWIFIVLTVYGIFISISNLLDGLPSGTWFGANCHEKIFKYASFRKAVDYWQNLFTGRAKLSPVILKYLFYK